MSRIRLACPPEALERSTPLADDAEAALAAWQARVGEIFTVVSPCGRFYRARLLPGAREVRPFEEISPAVEPPAGRVLLQSLPERERMLWIIQKAVELGATGIQPLLPMGGEGHGPRQDKSSIWDKVAREAARQCRRAMVPPVHAPRLLAEALPSIRDEALLLLDVGEGRVPLARLVHGLARVPVHLLVGHEGGWHPEERRAALEAGAVRIGVGARILRTETAALAALALLGGEEE